MTIREIDAYMSNWAKPSYSASWDNDGIMLCLDRDREITRVTVALEINADVIAAAVKNGSELIITHHPFIFYPIKRISYCHKNQIPQNAFDCKQIPSYTLWKWDKHKQTQQYGCCHTCAKRHVFHIAIQINACKKNNHI